MVQRDSECPGLGGWGSGTAKRILSDLDRKTFGTLIKKEKKVFLKYKEIQMGSGAKSYMRKGFLIGNAQIFNLKIYDFAPDPF